MEFPAPLRIRHKKKVTYWTNRFLEKAPCGISLSDGTQQVGHVISKTLEFVWSTGEELILPLQFGLIRNLDVSFLQSSRKKRSASVKCHLSANKLDSHSVLRNIIFFYLSLSRSSFALKSAWCLFLISWLSCEHLVSSSLACSLRPDKAFCRLAYSVSPSLFRLTLQ